MACTETISNRGFPEASSSAAVCWGRTGQNSATKLGSIYMITKIQKRSSVYQYRKYRCHDMPPSMPVSNKEKLECNRKCNLLSQEHTKCLLIYILTKNAVNKMSLLSKKKGLYNFFLSYAFQKLERSMKNKQSKKLKLNKKESKQKSKRRRRKYLNDSSQII